MKTQHQPSSFNMPGAFVLTLLAIAVFCPANARADERDDEIRQLRGMINTLDQKLRELERKQELRDEAAAATAKAAAETTPKITASDKGFSVAAPDNSSQLRLRALVHADSRWYGDHDGADAPGREGFVLRHARIIFEGRLSKILQFQIIPEYGGDSFCLLDASIGLDFSPAAQLKLGKFKAPVSLEQLQSDSWAFFTERSLASQLVPNRDIGVQLGGAFFNGALEYQIGVFNGVGDGRGTLTNADTDNGKDAAARIVAKPFMNMKDSPLAGLGIGIAGSYGRQSGEQARTAGYRTDGQQALFAYRAGVVQDGELWRISPQAYYYHGPLGILAEYMVSTGNLRPAAGQPAVEITNKAWQIAAGYVLTGEDSSYEGVTPAKPFDLEKGTWGAVELVARLDHIDIDRDAFPLLADPAASAKSAGSWGVGVNWYLTRAFRFSVDYNQTSSKSADATTPTGAVLKNGEKVILTRAQIAF
ncbi:MAG: OprO/OprP family phosphate-selective porin [Opitutaceae bacterium]|nr:OprO/OprP family phosphate-selective porin [Opitutaceae bacterium]